MPKLIGQDVLDGHDKLIEKVRELVADCETQMEKSEATFTAIQNRIDTLNVQKQKASDAYRATTQLTSTLNIWLRANDPEFKSE